MIEHDSDEFESLGGDDGETVACPECRDPVYEDAERCPNCGHYLSREDASRRRPWWVVAGVLACLATVFWWILNP